MESIFPFIQPQIYTDTDAPADETLALYADVAWDFENGRPRFMRGEPVIVTGLPAVISWAIRALKQERFLNEVYTWNYGNELMGLTGQQWLQETKQAEAARYVRECLTESPYINSVDNVSVSFDSEAGLLALSCRIQTIYGEATLNV